jgi:hypothetical protein
LPGRPDLPVSESHRANFHSLFVVEADLPRRGKTLSSSFALGSPNAGASKACFLANFLLTSRRSETQAAFQLSV